MHSGLFSGATLCAGKRLAVLLCNQSDTICTIFTQNINVYFFALYEYKS